MIGMKKILIIIFVIVLILIVPIPMGTYKDGGTKVWAALTYKVVKWNRLLPLEFANYDNPDIQDTCLHKTSIYKFPDNLSSLDDLFDMEMKAITKADEAKIIEIDINNWTDFFETELGVFRSYYNGNEKEFTVETYGLKLKEKYMSKLAYRGFVNDFSATIKAKKIKSYFTVEKDATAVFDLIPGDIYSDGPEVSENCNVMMFEIMEDGAVYMHLISDHEDVMHISENREEKNIYTHYCDLNIEDIHGTLYLRP